MSKTVYIAGKMNGLPEAQVREKFERFSSNLQRQGYSVVSPAENRQSSDTWEHSAKHSIKSMLDCDEVHLLPCWQESPEAQLERDIAIRLGMQVVYH